MKIHPGETLKEMMGDREYDVHEVARQILKYRLNSFDYKTWFPDSNLDIDAILKEIILVLGGDKIDLPTAIGFGAVFGTGHEFWLNLQKNYDEEEA